MTQQFKEFKIGDLFDINRGDVKNQKDLKFVEYNGINFIAQNNINNGFVGRVKLEDYKKFKKGSIVIGRQTGVVYYQKNDFITTDGVLVCNFKKGLETNDLSNLYITSLINKFMVNFGYTNTVSATKLREISLNLPITSEGEIDFEYMENYIKEIEQKYIQNLRSGLDGKINNLLELIQKTEDDISDENIQALKEKMRLEYSQKEFKEFKVGDLFKEIVIGKQPISSNRYKVQKEGMKPVITGVTINNGVGFYSHPEKTKLYKNILTLSKDGEYAGKPFIQKEDVILGGHSLGLIPKYDCKYTLLFIASIFNKLLGRGFWRHGGVMGSVTLDKLNNIDIYLPINSNGEIDYNFMERYVKSLESVHTHTFRVCEEERIGIIEELV